MWARPTPRSSVLAASYLWRESDRLAARDREHHLAVAIDAPVSAIEGIGPAASEALATVHVHTVFDLLRTPFSRIREAVASLASEKEVASWRAMAVLLEVAEVTPQWAEALARAGIGTVDDLRRKSLAETEAILLAARDQGTIPHGATSGQIAEILKDAAVLAFTGTVVGTVVGAEREPIAGATVRVGSRASTTDERGRFRLARIPLGRTLPLRVEHAGHPTVAVEHPRVLRNGEVVAVQTVSIGGEGAGPGVRLSELDGEVVPVPQGHAVRQVIVAPDALRAGDVLMVREIAPATSEAELVSRLKGYEDGEVLVFVVRVPVSALPGEARVKDHYRFTGAGFAPIALSPRALHQYKIRLRMKRAFADRPEPVSFEERLRFLGEQEYFFIRLRTS